MSHDFYKIKRVFPSVRNTFFDSAENGRKRIAVTCRRKGAETRRRATDGRVYELVFHSFNFFLINIVFIDKCCLY